MVVIAPEDPEATFRAGEQSVIEVVVDVVDPVAENYAGFLAAGLASAINREIIERVAAEGQGYAVAAGEPEADAIPPEVIAAPTRAEIRNVSPSTPHVISYFAPAVLALILQHLAVTLVAMSLVRERTSGVIELFRIAPVSAAEVLTGKVLAFGLIGGAIAALTVALLVLGLGVPMVGAVGLIVPRDRPAAPRVARARPADRRRLGLGTTGRPAVPARAARVGVLQRLRPADRRVH